MKYILGNYFEYIENSKKKKMDIVIYADKIISQEKLELIDMIIYKYISENNIKHYQIKNYLRAISNSILKNTNLSVTLDIDIA